MNDLTLYKRLAPILETGDVILYEGNSVIGKTIRWWTKHILLRKAPDKATRKICNHGNQIIRIQEYEQQTDRRWCLDARAAGVFPVLLSDYLANYDGHAYLYRLKDQYNCVRNSIGCEALSYAGKCYDFLGLIKNAVGLVSAELRKLWCTEAIFLALRDGGRIVSGDKGPRPDMVPFLIGPDRQVIFKEPIKLF